MNLAAELVNCYLLRY